MAVQTSVSNLMIPRFSGLVSGAAKDLEWASRTLEDAAGCALGIALCEGATPGPGGRARKMTSSADVKKIVGITAYTPTHLGGSAPDLALNSELSLLRRGYIAMRCPVTITVDTVLYWVVSGAESGTLTSVVTAADLASGIRCVIPATAGNVGFFSVNLT